MNTKIDEIASRFSKWLQRYLPPRHLRANSEACQDEADALLRVILKATPQTDFMPWLNRVLENMDYRMKTRAWPTVAELNECCLLKHERKSTSPAGAFSLDSAVIAAKRMGRGEPVADWWLFGERTNELYARGLVEEKIIENYREAFRRSREPFARMKARQESQT